MNSEKLEKEIQILRNVYNELKNVSDFQQLINHGSKVY